MKEKGNEMQKNEVLMRESKHKKGEKKLVKSSEGKSKAIKPTD